jgi:hypothetical protein
MLSNFIWWAGIALEFALLTRGASTGLIRQYPLFYAYLGSVLIKELLGLVSYTLAPNVYASVYWPTELATIVASFAVIIEIFRKSVRHNPGIVRFSQSFLLIAFGLTTFYACSDFSHRGFTSLYRAIAELGRDLRLLEGALLIVLLWLFAKYRIALGRNLLSLTVGYSFWIGINLTDFAFLYAGNESSHFLRTLVPASYTVTLAIWCSTLWSLQTEPAQPERQFEHDYEFFAAKTRGALARTSHRLARVLKP